MTYDPKTLARIMGDAEEQGRIVATPDIITAATEVVKQWKECPETVASMAMDCCVRALSAALDAAAPGKPGAVPEGVAVFDSLDGEYTIVFANRDTFRFSRNLGGHYVPHGIGAYGPDEYERFSGYRRLTPDEAAAFFAKHGTPLHGAPGEGGGAK